MLATIHRITPRAAGVGELTTPELEELLTAIADRADLLGRDRAARLERGRAALELELARRLEE